MLRETMGKKIVAEAARRLAPTGGTSDHRPDLFLADHQKVTTASQRILVGWASNLELPSTEAIENWVLGTFNGTVRMEHKSMRWYPKQACFSVICAWLTPTRRLEDAKKMAKVAPGRYLDAETKNVWEVVKGDDDATFLSRVTDEDLDDLLKERKAVARKTITQKRAATFATLDSDGMIQLDPGDEVRFYYKGAMKIGRIQRFDGDKAIIASGKQTFRIAAPAVTEVVTKDPKTVGDYKAKAKAYWNKIFPKEYVNKWMGAGKRQGSADPR